MLASISAKPRPPTILSFMQRGDYGLEQLAQEIALAEIARGGSWRRSNDLNLAVEPQSTELAIGQIEVDLLAQLIARGECCCRSRR